MFHSLEKRKRGTHRFHTNQLIKMLRSVFFFIFTAIIIEITCTISVGYIQNAKYVSNDTTIIITYTNTCTECICSGFFFSAPSLYVGLNCYKNNKTCELFANYSTRSMMTTNLNSTFIFIQQPPVQNTTTGNSTFLIVSKVGICKVVPVPGPKF